MTQSSDAQANFEAYLQYLSYNDDRLLINGESKYPILLPQRVSKESIENAVYEYCQKYNIDYVSTENVNKWSIAMVKEYHLQRLKPKGKVEKTTTAQESKEQPIVLTDDLTREVTFQEVSAILSTSIKKDEAAKLITFCGMLLAQSNEDQLNLGFQSESSAGKSYIPIEVASYFPKEEVEILASASPTAFYHDGKWDNEKKVLFRDLEHKNLIFLDQPHFQLLEKLRPLLSKDMKELYYKITDKNQRQGLRTKNVIIRGFPSVFFCTTRTDPDEQEKTRMILLSPSTDQEKLRESLELVSLKKSNPEEYRKRIQHDPRRSWLVDRIKAIRQWGIREVLVPNDGKDVYERFMKEHVYLLPRHQRDFPRIFSFIKAHALLNCFKREKVLNGHADKPVAIIANQADIDAGFQLYKEIEQSNELGLSPYIFKIYREVIQPLLNPQVGLSRKEIRSKYYTVFHKTLAAKLEESVIMQLEGAGLIEQSPDPEDKRKMLVYPTVSGNISSDRKCIPQDSGATPLEQYPREVQPAT
jgi:hypothetical protein